MTSHPRSQPEGRQETAVKDRLANIMTWLREPDWTEEATLAWVMDWVNRRPIAELAMVAMLMPEESPRPECGVQTDYVMVPREPTREMWAAGGNAAVDKRGYHHDIVVECVYRAMIEAAALSPEPAGDDLHTLVEQLRAENDRLRAGWQSIDTAPKDGTRILLFQAGRGAFEGWWHTAWPHPEQYWMDYADSEPDPTHWQPALALPSAHSPSEDGK